MLWVMVRTALFRCPLQPWNGVKEYSQYHVILQIYRSYPKIIPIISHYLSYITRVRHYEKKSRLQSVLNFVV